MDATAEYTEFGTCYKVNAQDGSELMQYFLTIIIGSGVSVSLISSLLITIHGLSSADPQKRTGLIISTVLLIILLIALGFYIFSLKQKHDDILKNANPCTNSPSPSTVTTYPPAIYTGPPSTGRPPSTGGPPSTLNLEPGYYYGGPDPFNPITIRIISSSQYIFNGVLGNYSIIGSNKIITFDRVIVPPASPLVPTGDLPRVLSSTHFSIGFGGGIFTKRPSM